jgi:hypothetical protein
LESVRSARQANDPGQTISANETLVEEPHQTSAESVIETKELTQEETDKEPSQVN